MIPLLDSNGELGASWTPGEASPKIFGGRSDAETFEYASVHWRVAAQGGPSPSGCAWRVDRVPLPNPFAAPSLRTLAPWLRRLVHPSMVIARPRSWPASEWA